MKINIRKNVFETNSSSSHSLVVATKEQKEGFENGTLWFNVTHSWNAGHFLKNPETGERLPAFVDGKTVSKIVDANRKAEKKDAFLSEELINTHDAIYDEDSFGSPYEKMEAEEREDGTYDLHIYYFFG